MGKQASFIDLDGELATRETVSRLLDADQVADLMATTRRTVHRLVHEGSFPKPLLIGRYRRWRATDYNAWVAQQPVEEPSSSRPRPKRKQVGERRV